MTKKELNEFIRLTKKYFGNLTYQEYPGAPSEYMVSEALLEDYETYIKNEIKSK